MCNGKILWINGAYGAGKTSVVEVLHEMLPGSFIYDPENAGSFIRSNFPNSLWKDDYQDYPLWREINFKMILQLVRDVQQTILVPMTIVKPECYDEIIVLLRGVSVDVRHFILRVDENTLRERLLGLEGKPDS